MTRVAVESGAARGIGAATVGALAADGWVVVAVDRCRDDPWAPYALGTEAELAAVAAEAADGGRVTAVVADTPTRRYSPTQSFSPSRSTAGWMR